jgi:hypothetical protein
MSATSEKMKISFLANFDISYSAAFNASQKKKNAFWLLQKSHVSQTLFRSSTCQFEG